MKRILLTLLFFIPTCLYAERVDITVKIKGFRNTNGQVLIALHNKAKVFPTKPELAFQKARIPIKSNMSLSDTVEHTFKNVPSGIYAITSVHDENSNDDMDLFLFRPAEGYGTSNDIRGLFGPPNFHDAKFEVSSKNISIDIPMRY